MGRMPSDRQPPEGIAARLVSSAEAADPPGTNDYDSFAEAYSADNEINLYNAYYERPATWRSPGTWVAGGSSTRAAVRARCSPRCATGAQVTGIDASAGMLELARRRLGPDADLRVADLCSPLPFADDVFDDVVSVPGPALPGGLGPTLTELRRVLTPGGRLIVSVDHPLPKDPTPGRS